MSPLQMVEKTVSAVIPNLAHNATNLVKTEILSEVKTFLNHDTMYTLPI